MKIKVLFALFFLIFSFNTNAATVECSFTAGEAYDISSGECGLEVLDGRIFGIFLEKE